MANPLTLILPVIPGTSLDTLGVALKQSQGQLNDALNSIGIVHYARILLLDASVPNLQPSVPPSPGSTPSYVIAVITEYDGDFDAYVQDFVDKVGAIFDILLQAVVGGKELTPVANNAAAFTEFVKTNDASQNGINSGTLYQAYTATVQTILASLPPSS